MARFTSKLFTLEQGQLYGWTMYPGNGEEPYRSPVGIEEVRPLGLRRFDLDFQNIFYAAGVQRMCYRLRMLRRESTYLIAEQIDKVDGKLTDRVVIVEHLTRAWLLHAAPDCSHLSDKLFDAAGKPIASELKRLTA